MLVEHKVKNIDLNLFFLKKKIHHREPGVQWSEKKYRNITLSQFLTPPYSIYSKFPILPRTRWLLLLPFYLFYLWKFHPFPFSTRISKQVRAFKCYFFLLCVRNRSFEILRRRRTDNFCSRFFCF